MKTLQQIMRRIHRIFTHAHMDHRELFMEVEKEQHLYQRFFSFVQEYMKNQVPGLIDLQKDNK